MKRIITAVSALAVTAGVALAGASSAAANIHLY